MKKIYALVVWLILGCAAVNAQTAGDSIRIQGFIPISRSDEAKWMQRLSGDMQRLTQEKNQLTDLTCDVLVIGSSSARMWNSIATDLAPLKVINRAYGGSTIRDNIYNYTDVTRGYQPKMILLYVENDLAGNKASISPGECYDLFRLYEQLIHRDFPEATLFILSFKPSPSRAGQLQDQLIINRLLKDYADQTDKVEYIDITKGMYDAQGVLRTDIFLDDKLHMNQLGYDAWTKEVRPALLREPERIKN